MKYYRDAMKRCSQSPNNYQGRAAGKQRSKEVRMAVDDTYSTSVLLSICRGSIR